MKAIRLIAGLAALALLAAGCGGGAKTPTVAHLGSSTTSSNSSSSSSAAALGQLLVGLERLAERLGIARQPGGGVLGVRARTRRAELPRPAKSRRTAAK